MKTLILVRHAKSSWKDPSLADRLRPLNKRGLRDAPEMGRRLAERGVEVDHILSSPAVRALETAKALAECIGYPRKKIVEEKRLYLASAPEWLEVIRALDNRLDRVMCVGHNPGLTILANRLSRLDLENVPTCGIVELKFAVRKWSQVGEAEPVEAEFDYPKKGKE